MENAEILVQGCVEHLHHAQYKTMHHIVVVIQVILEMHFQHARG